MLTSAQAKPCPNFGPLFLARSAKTLISVSAAAELFVLQGDKVLTSWIRGLFNSFALKIATPFIQPEEEPFVF